MMEVRTLPFIPGATDIGTDWEYAMRREMQEIIPGLFLGPYAAANKTKLNSLLRSGITHIVCIRQDVEANFVRANFPEHFRYLILNIADLWTENIIQHFPKVKEFVDNCLNNGGKALIHGNAGISRSAALVIAYIMEKYGISYKCALQHVQQRRFCISPNESFANQLMEYEPIYKARHTLESGQSSQITGVLKRKHTEDETEHGDVEMSGDS